jgi:hypothetical protein
VSPLALAIKKWWSVGSERKMTALVILGSILAAAISYLRNVPEFAPWIILVQGWLVYATTQPVYFFFVKPFFRRLGVWLTNRFHDVTNINQPEPGAKTAVEPSGGLVINDIAPPAREPQIENFDH